MTGHPAAPPDTPAFILLTGALGSGKTTLLGDYLALPDTADTGVIMNDAGAINVDAAVIEAGHRDRPLARLSNGCICCSAGGSLQDAIDELLTVHARSGSGRLRRIVLETSGLAEPGPILRALGQLPQRGFRLRIVSTFDCLAPAAADAVLPHYAAQLAAAQAVVLTKADLLDPAGRPAAGQAVRRFNPLAVQILSDDRRERARLAFADAGYPPAFRPPPGGQAPVGLHPRISVVLAGWMRPVRWPAVCEWLENIAGFCGDRLLRVKGFVTVDDSPQPLLINGVGGTFDTPRRMAAGPVDQPEGLVLILRDMTLDELCAFGNEASRIPPVLSRWTPLGPDRVGRMAGRAPLPRPVA